jgi:hypothetical protein
MTDSRGQDLPAARWAHQQNIGETSQDRQDKSDGVRCVLRGGPCDGLHVAEHPQEGLAPGGRGYAPEHIRRSSDISSIDYYYNWFRRDHDGVHHYTLDGRKGYAADEWHDEVLVVFKGGPLHGQKEWVSRPPTDGPVKISRVVEDVYYDEAYVSQWSFNGEYTGGGKIRCRLADYYGKEKGEEIWAGAADIRSSLRGFAPERVSVPTHPDGADHYYWTHDNVYRFSGSTWTN